ncbi:hypothetical protein CY34DRAFT_496524 [Suillus luteus UH-Slu-Lm8-n1]|uniref:WD40 repeat-like protein n=1 Tax=Suillus luteus UH-Slu-Lm8-n1 TaxID=930992 RepID=A0A0D0BIB9_9AGAM|nr:hypothetical protein CY34DRAFT_496524 [Suillus luteus UH-Slu-Lm8-n1]
MTSSTSKMTAMMPRQTMRGHTGWVNDVVHLPGGQRIITCSLDGSLRLWDLESGTQTGNEWWDEKRVDAVCSMALSPNGKIIATGSGSSDFKLTLWDVETRKIISKWAGHSNVVCALCWSADGDRVVSGSWDGTARVWDVKKGKTVLAIETGYVWVWAVIYSPDSSKFATGGDKDNAVKIWDAKTGKRLTTLKHDVMVCSLAWTSDGKKLISGSYELIRIFDTATWKQIAFLEGHAHLIHAISLSPNNRLLASASFDSTACLWNLDTNLQVGPPLQHEGFLASVCLSRDGQVLVTACEHNAYAWDVHNILKFEAGFEDLLTIGANIRTPRSSLDNKSFLAADATQCPGQFGSVDELSPAFFAGMEADVDVRNQYFNCLALIQTSALSPQ